VTRARITEDTEWCVPSVGPVMAYSVQRAADRYSTTEPRHAVTLFAIISGMMDAECGKSAPVEVGPWDPEDPLNCPRCTRFVAGMVVMPPDRRRRPRPAPVPELPPITEPVQLDLLPEPQHVPRPPRLVPPPPAPPRPAITALSLFDDVA